MTTTEVTVTAVAAYDSPNPADNGSVSASMNAVSRERIPPGDIAAKTVTPTYRPVMFAGLHPTYSMTTPMDVYSIYMVASPPPYSAGEQRVPIILRRRCIQVSLEDSRSSVLVSAQIPFIPVLPGAREQDT